MPGRYCTSREMQIYFAHCDSLEQNNPEEPERVISLTVFPISNCIFSESWDSITQIPVTLNHSFSMMSRSHTDCHLHQDGG